MNRSIRIEIAESAEELKRLHKQQPDKHLAQRILFLYVLKTGKLTRLSHGPAILNQHRKTLGEWLDKYRQGGLEGLLQRQSPPGPSSSVSPELEAKFKAVLESTGFPGGYREAHAFAQEHGCNLGYHAIRKFLRSRFGTKLKVARPKHHKQAPEAVDAFKKRTLLPKSKRPSPASRGTRPSTSTSKTKADLAG